MHEIEVVHAFTSFFVKQVTSYPN